MLRQIAVHPVVTFLLTLGAILVLELLLRGSVVIGPAIWGAVGGVVAVRLWPVWRDRRD